eukprot:Lithocolla_globosa_v1_NODE_1518_length_2517_cov_9.259139.p1 type:complete len:210 gc:universal NODE_1518_length_2517_cov_9.259139:855-226(-)
MLLSVGFSLTLAVGMIAVPVAVILFTDEKPNFKREVSHGISPLAYFLGKNIVLLYSVILMSILFASFYYSQAGFWMPFLTFFSVVLLTFFGCTGVGVLMVFLVDSHAILLGIITCLCISFLNGYSPLYSSTVESGYSWLLDMCFSRWATEALFASEVDFTYHVFETERLATTFGFTLDRVSFDFMMMVTLGCMLRVLGWAAMLWYVRKA